MNNRGEFSSRLGFVLAAAGSAVGLGNIWGFPTQVASNGGAAFVLVYIVLAFMLAYPVLMAELIIGRATRSNMVDALGKISGNALGKVTGVWGFITVSLILSFYALVAGWMLSHFFQTITDLFGQETWSTWLVTSSLTRDIVFCGLFLCLTAAIVTGGVAKGIEKWSVRLMPALFIIIGLLIVYVSTLEGASKGWSAYLLPDFSLIMDPGLLISAMGQAFFSMSLGVGTMLVYGSYVNKKENLPTLGASVALVDIAVAILAGMLIIPAMYVALHNGIEIFNEAGTLIEGPNLIFAVLPSLFHSMGQIGVYVAFVFFALMMIAALTSSISMLEVPVAYVVENKGLSRKSAVWGLTLIVFISSSIIAFNMQSLFGLVIDLTTKYSQPLLGFMLCIYAGWVWKRNEILKEIKQGYENAEQGLFWKVWPWYVKFVCPVIILLMFIL
ncbi:sodium-dependent transporter [Paraglaciecola aquimarina]|uniref:Sodium-dependent transporter n=1 Tax=Paraglaciecola aquimarina TaxID=1235557 RepID=A0ABU3SYU4_9ALTE|nr:sodium-dependent transporter [Paraglaciecola aquimarina]MDU0355185.1 sodium-dependent transporter [Paraglaciecola aquimarina]